MNSTAIVFPDIDELSLGAARFFESVVTEAIQQRGKALVALSGGSTPLKLFSQLSSAPLAERIDWKAVHFFWCDERCVPPEHPESNFGQARRAFLQPLTIPDANLHRIQGELEPEQAALAYRETLRQYRSVELDWPVFDLVLLGMGADGHTASLFPGEDSRMSTPVLAVTANYQGRPAQRITLTPLVFNAARQVLFLVAGEDKADAVRRVLTGPLDLNSYPAQAISPNNGSVSWFLDAGAARKMDV